MTASNLRFMLDTDHVSYAIRGHGNVGQALLARAPSEVCVSAITAAELCFGAEKRSSRKLHRIVDAFLDEIEVLPFDVSAAVAFGKVSWKLVDQGTPIGIMDTLIAAHAKSQGLTLVTNNKKHFARVSGLKLQNWF